MAGKHSRSDVPSRESNEFGSTLTRSQKRTLGLVGSLIAGVAVTVTGALLSNEPSTPSESRGSMVAAPQSFGSRVAIDGEEVLAPLDFSAPPTTVEVSDVTTSTTAVLAAPTTAPRREPTTTTTQAVTSSTIASTVPATTSTSSTSTSTTSSSTTTTTTRPPTLEEAFESRYTDLRRRVQAGENISFLFKSCGVLQLERKSDGKKVGASNLLMFDGAPSSTYMPGYFLVARLYNTPPGQNPNVVIGTETSAYKVIGESTDTTQEVCGPTLGRLSINAANGMMYAQIPSLDYPVLAGAAYE